MNPTLNKIVAVLGILFVLAFLCCLPYLSQEEGRVACQNYHPMKGQCTPRHDTKIENGAPYCVCKEGLK